MVKNQVVTLQTQLHLMLKSGRSKSVTFRVTIQSKEKTLEEKDLEQLHKNILEKVSNKFKAKIRT